MRMWLYRRQSLPLSGLTNAQLADHYADCIKLSTENVRTVYNSKCYLSYVVIWVCRLMQYGTQEYFCRTLDIILLTFVDGHFACRA